ncbi:tellurite resistance protein [Ensifer adhaerens]|uniref:Tellurite resistance protein n=1 Tax=Ensifer adhaerens TaxID=106592 RepID=A0ACC5SVV1_ENSAD|nr:SLAC1 anion channel family protein [Ensifer adhaerens]MBP1873013.1 tellurite resistance protein [Ensifer adhaerens]
MSNVGILDDAPVTPAHGHTIANLPINLFASVMGLTGLSLAWREAVKVIAVPGIPGELIGWFAAVTFITLAIGYAAKWVRHPAAVATEFRHPVQGNFFATIAVGLLLLSAFFERYSVTASQVVWIIGLILTFTLAYLVATRFLISRENAEHTLPPLLIPGVATLDIAVTGKAMPFAWAHEINVFAFAVGSVIAGIFITLIFARLRHHDPLPLASRPSMMVLVAPFAVGFLAYTNLTGTVDILASVLFYFAFFLMLVLSPIVFRSHVPFSVAWWAISFPLAAFSIAFFRYAEAAGTELLRALAIAMFVFLTGAIGIVFVRTMNEVLSGKLFRVH